ncbi:hypothetical protein ACPF04_06300 [Campylobacter sp. MOP51]|uniref:hypothetical protein n=1 Tax=Campylobacter canis TaxID=3378588 RepID=UPI003C52E80C
MLIDPISNIKLNIYRYYVVGIQVLWVKAYHLKVLEIDHANNLIKAKSSIDDNIIIEKDACRSLVPNERFYSFRKDVDDTYAIFPYDVIDEEKHPILFDDFCTRFPRAGAYLKKHKKTIQENIKDKKYKRNDSQRWHLYTRIANKQQNGYFKLNKQYLEPVLFPAYIFEKDKKNGRRVS